MSLPPPLVSAEVSLAGHEWFPLFGDRLRKSKWWRRASDLARARNVMLWCDAWKASPAGSLPDDDDELAEAAGFGMDADAFIAAKAEIMAPWTLCSDGRWYQPTLCEQVLDAWDRLGDRRKVGRERQARYRERVRQQAGVTRHQRGCDASPASDDASPGRTGQDRTGEDNPVASAAPKQAVESYPEAYLRLWKAAGEKMRRRSSLKKSFGPWRTVAKRVGETSLEACLDRYQREDADFARTGGPGLHIWLAENRWEHWLPTKTDPAERTHEFWRRALKLHTDTRRWGDELGPAPGLPGCLAPNAILSEFGMTAQVIPLQQRKDVA